MFEVGARMVARSVIDDVQQVFMLLDRELDSFLADPAAWRPTILERDAQFAVLATLEPPYIVKHQDGVPPISEWPVRGRKDVPAAAAGEVIQGAPGAAGRFTGRARIVLHPDQVDDLDAGDVMVAPTTDPSWTPLFLSVGAVVCNVGAVNSHAAIVCRELGVPCAVSVLDATDRIPEGATVTVDGSSGAVTVVTVP
jgi:pyruvate,water dikinase